jgi:adenylate cyclase
MFFYGAPVENAGHAIDAVATVLHMQANLRAFNEMLVERGLTTLAMRAGIGSGPMVVGDAGPADAADYTVIGDTVNLAARLESANKATGTWILINQRGRDLVADHFLVRPIANLQVVGKSEGVFVHEPLCPIDEATDEQHALVTLTTAMVEHFQHARFEDCLTAAVELDERFGPGKLTTLYREHCEQYLAHGTPDDFNGRIVLTEK